MTASYERITTEELSKVSSLMNEIFLEMIGADPEQGAIIKRAEISPDFDIIVYGPNERTLNPDRDLNGASRRALTLAFILALTKVSEVEAPNVIDTPLGMTSGYVKRSILRTAVRSAFPTCAPWMIMIRTCRAFPLALALFASAMWSGLCIAAETPAQSGAIEFNRDIRPILWSRCVKCHGRGKQEGGLRLDRREAFIYIF